LNGKIVIDKNRVESKEDKSTEWYVNDERGLSRVTLSALPTQKLFSGIY
jgi:hypothetical protein